MIRPPTSSFNQIVLSGYIIQRSPTVDLETWGENLHRPGVGHRVYQHGHVKVLLSPHSTGHTTH